MKHVNLLVGTGDSVPLELLESHNDQCIEKFGLSVRELFAEKLLSWKDVYSIIIGKNIVGIDVYGEVIPDSYYREECMTIIDQYVDMKGECIHDSIARIKRLVRRPITDDSMQIIIAALNKIDEYIYDIEEK